MNIETIGRFDRGFGEDIGDLGAVGVDGGIIHLVEGKGSGGRDDGEKAGVGIGDKLRFKRNCLDPGVKTVLFDLDAIVSGVEVELIVGDGG